MKKQNNKNFPTFERSIKEVKQQNNKNFTMFETSTKEVKEQNNKETKESTTKIKWIVIIIILCVIVSLFIGITVWFFLWSAQNTNLVNGIDSQGNPTGVDLGIFPTDPVLTEMRSVSSADIDPNSINNLGKSDNATGIEQSSINPCSAPNLIRKFNLKTGISECTCKFPYFGPYCTREFHDSEYVSIATDSDIPNLSYDVSTEKLSGVNSLSYVKTDEATNNIMPGTKLKQSGQSCTGICNLTKNCRGVVYNNSNRTCDLITSDITLNKNIQASNLFKENPTIFLNNKGKVRVLDKVFLYSGNIPFRHWIGRHEVVPTKINPNGFVSLDIDIAIQLNWVPERIVNESHLIGIWSNNPFKNLTAEINRNDVYIDKKGYLETSAVDYSLNLPPFITNSPIIYVGYINKNYLTNLRTKYVLAR